MATYLEISEKDVQINHLQPKRFHLVKKCENRSSRSWYLFSERSL